LCVQLVPYALTDLLGQEVVLKIEAYDPRDVFRGDYVAVNFTESQANKSLLSGVKEVEINKLYGKKIYAHLVKDEAVWKIDQLTLEKPNTGVYVSCVLEYYNKYDSVINLDFGVNRFYVEENTGTDVEKALRDGDVLARVKLWKGRMIMDDLIIQ
jgi:uncharacterized membrane-anchored protein